MFNKRCFEGRIFVFDLRQELSLFSVEIFLKTSVICFHLTEVSFAGLGMSWPEEALTLET